MRADAQKNYSHLLAVAHDVVAKHGVDASMRDIARRADVGLATLLRHFPTREALFEALLCTNLDELTQKADELETSNSPDEALVSRGTLRARDSCSVLRPRERRAPINRDA